MQENESKLQYLPHLLLGLVLLLLLCLLASPRLSMNMITLILILATSIYGTVKFITANHVEFVNYPTSYVLSRSNKKQI